MNFPGAGAPSGGASGYDPNDPNVKKLNSLMESCYAKTAMSGVAGFGLGALFGMFMASMAYDTPFHTAAPVTSTPAASTTATTATTTSGTAATSSSTTAQPKAATSSSPIARAAAATANSTVAPIKTPTAAAAAATTSAAAAAAPSASSAAGAAMLPNPGAPLSSLPLRQQLAVGFKDMGARSYSTAKNFAMVGALFSGIECGIEGLRAKNDMGNGVAAGCITGAILARNGGPQAAAVGCAGFAAFSAAIDAWLRMPKDE